MTGSRGSEDRTSHHDSNAFFTSAVFSGGGGIDLPTPPKAQQFSTVIAEMRVPRMKEKIEGIFPFDVVVILAAFACIWNDQCLMAFPVYHGP